MKAFKYNVDKCFAAACNSLGKEMGVSTKQNVGFEPAFSQKKSKKRKLSTYQKIENVCLTNLVKLFI